MRLTKHAVLFLVTMVTLSATPALADPGHAWDGKRAVSRQRSNDLFYNSYVGPYPNGAAAGMYVSPLPVPPHVGHTYTTYQPLMPHEMMYRHTRSYHTHHPGAGWTRTNVRYGTGGGWMQSAAFRLYDDSMLSWMYRGTVNGNVVKR